VTPVYPFISLRLDYAVRPEKKTFLPSYWTTSASAPSRSVTLSLCRFLFTSPEFPTVPSLDPALEPILNIFRYSPKKNPVSASFQSRRNTAVTLSRFFFIGPPGRKLLPVGLRVLKLAPPSATLSFLFSSRWFPIFPHPFCYFFFGGSMFGTRAQLIFWPAESLLPGAC